MASSSDDREISEGLQYQGEDEEIAYTLDVSNVGSSPGSVSVVVKNNRGEDVTSTVMPTNSPSVTGNVITLSELKNLVAGLEYRVEVKFTISGSVYECYARIKGQE
jgi:hypothetical protein